MSDLLDDLVKASREAPVAHDEADETRRRILAAANHQARTTSRRRLAPWVLPLVAALVATGALAAGPLGVTQAIFGPEPAPVPTVAAPAKTAALRGATAPSLQAPTSAEAPSEAPPAAPVADAPAPPAAPTPVVDVPAAPATMVPSAVARPEAAQPTTLSPAARPIAAPTQQATTPGTARPDAPVAPARAEAPVAGARGEAPSPPPGAPVPPVPPADPSDDLYRAAHDRHFRGGDPSSAVEAWDRYLAAAPRGRFAVEARYNRALALLKAGRRSEGLAALEPFASGAFGNYRRDEALRLLGAARDAGAP